MFCPNCGLQENHSNQFCRACGSNLNVVRSAVERPDSITASAVSARDEIGRAIAFKIREAKSPDELATIAEDVLPEIEKFLESPEEKRLRRLRNGTMVALIGLGAAIAFAIAAVLMHDAGVFFVAGLGIVTLFIGLSLIFNALLFTVPKKACRTNRLTRPASAKLMPADKPTTCYCPNQTMYFLPLPNTRHSI